MTDNDLLRRFALRQPAGDPVEVAPELALIDRVDVEEFIKSACTTFEPVGMDDVLRRALTFSLQQIDAEIEVQFIILSAALDSVLTYFYRDGEGETFSKNELELLESDVRSWLEQFSTRNSKDAPRESVNGKLRQLNRIPFASGFMSFCGHYSLDFSDLWPVVGSAEEWPLMEIRDRLILEDPLFTPGEAMTCATDHLRWVVERMLLAVLKWPIKRSNVSAEYLQQTSLFYNEWQSERAQLASSLKAEL